MIDVTEQTNEDVPQIDSTAGRSWFHRLIEPPVLSIVMTVLFLAVIWAVTLNLIARERASADRTAAAMTMDVADTYEAQVVRALREIDHTLKMVRYQLDDKPAQVILEDLRSEELLPPEIVFTVSIIDARGEILDSTNRSSIPENVANMDFFKRAKEQEDMVIGQPQHYRGSDEWWLSFSRRFGEAGQRFTGIVAVSVHAGYFVSGYESDALGEHGVLGLVGTDGVFRVRRTGNDISAGTTINYNALVQESTPVDDSAEVTVNRWDDTRRYTIARKLYEFQLAIVVGLSEAEQLAPADRIQRRYIRRAGLVSILVVVIGVLLGRLTWQLRKSRTNAIEERAAHARNVEYLAYHDNLTGLPNRALFSRLLYHQMQHARRYKKRLALMFLDLDHFKAINDSLGHEAGDELLKKMGRRLRESLRESDIVARLGGDEFIMLLPEITEETQVTTVAGKILAAVAKPFTLAEQEFRITISIGIAMFPADGEDEQTLMKSADVAMYHVKEGGKNNFRFYSEKLNTDSLERLTLESSLRKALENNEFRLFYQSKQDMATGRITGIEALLRWQHPDLGLIPPMQFIPLAEENGLIVPIGRWVFKTACRQNLAWQNEGFPKLSMAVNISKRQFFDEDFLKDVGDALQESGMAPELLELEITEAIIMHDMDGTIRILKDLKQMRVRVAIDDFGIGYSSLSKLKEFPLNTLKIDGSFIQNMIPNTETKSLTTALIDLGKSLGFTVVAEGVESKEQADFLRTHSCDQFQGFYINKPMPPEKFTSEIREQLKGYTDTVSPD
ncbi:MAG: EAL domain-containing protein [Candidatus Krumholzibacteriota bacterium]|nr:EAL domain-containing protein [Candidatus Krumholzibacteriota bacterium]